MSVLGAVISFDLASFEQMFDTGCRESRPVRHEEER